MPADEASSRRDINDVYIFRTPNDTVVGMLGLGGSSSADEASGAGTDWSLMTEPGLSMLVVPPPRPPGGGGSFFDIFMALPRQQKAVAIYTEFETPSGVARSGGRGAQRFFARLGLPGGGPKPGPAIYTEFETPSGVARVSRPGGMKIAGNESPRPDDRVFCGYNYFNTIFSLGAAPRSPVSRSPVHGKLAPIYHSGQLFDAPGAPINTTIDIRFDIYQPQSFPLVIDFEKTNEIVSGGYGLIMGGYGVIPGGAPAGR